MAPLEHDLQVHRTLVGWIQNNFVLLARNTPIRRQQWYGLQGVLRRSVCSCLVQDTYCITAILCKQVLCMKVVGVLLTVQQ